ncbi:MAG: CofC family guanylyltransferase [Methanimicrococcus sp.]|nr:CofC family guanylyltransferase [Methanimicrococcus sp.]
MKPLRTVIPFKSDNPKSRLSSFFSEEERRTFVELSLKNVLTALDEAGICSVDFLLKNPLADAEMQKIKTFFNGTVSFQTDERDLSTAVNSYLKTSADPVLIVMADLSLLTKDDVFEMIQEPKKEPKKEPKQDPKTMADGAIQKLIRIAPGKDGGTNMIYIEAPDVYEVDYYGNSCQKHINEAKKKGLLYETYDSFFAASDIDEPEDLESILKYGQGEIYDFVVNAFKNHK